jgi:delta-aminolevulinic acid dehydratase/porphobilinogen synthase
MDKYINMLFIKISQKYKINIIVIMSYSSKYKKVSKSYKLVINSKKKKTDRKSLDFTSKTALIMEMVKWAEKN